MWEADLSYLVLKSYMPVLRLLWSDAGSVTVLEILILLVKQRVNASAPRYQAMCMSGQASLRRDTVNALKMSAPSK